MIKQNDIDAAVEEFGFQIHPTCKICNSIYKPEIDKMILDGVTPARIAAFCTLIDPRDNKQRIPGSVAVVTKNIHTHRKHITIDKSKIEEAQQSSMVIYKARVREEISLETAKKLATQRMVDQLSDAESEFSMQDLAVPINLEQKERSVKVEEGGLQLNFARFIKSDNNNEQISGNEIKSLETSIQELRKGLENIGSEIRQIEGARGAEAS